ncbi:SdrH family protein [Staphylococcus hominis]|uniref:SdrH family protein n=1 Tax=Staphylococcus hominis TaxID=1290 RepID=UPI001F5918C7|nr:SdrH family protein [Staphylococcus hominis]MCI2843014.1 SdrH family protein [Staphylococcus hominis]MCI2852041.1 SdrH family protein [Staphylococcus hominis]MCI2858143.1 SdrH family protein [Staphylococcus hominis]MDS3892044.1 SdrH family protein [Staphylococcus hominis]
MIKQNVIRTSLIFAISATIFSHYSYAETSSNIESEDVDQKVNLQKTSDTQHSKIELSNENQNIKEFNHTNDETSNTEESKIEESQQESNETNSKEESTAEESQEESEEPNSTKESIAEESQQKSNETNGPEEPKTEKAHEADKKTDSIEEPKKEKVNDKNQQKSGIEHIHKNNTSSSEEKNHNKYKTAQKSKNYKNEDSTIFKQEEHQNVMSKSMKSKQNQIIQPYNDNTSSNVYSNTNYQKGKSQNSVSKTMFNQLFSRQLVENNHNNFEPTHLKQNNLYFQSDRRKESTYPNIYQIESRFSENILNRFNQYAKGAYKYNPYIINKVNHLDDNGEKITNKDFNHLIKKQKFDNQNLNILQEDSQYFRFQYFNPLNAKEYYKNLDEQVLSLITNDIGSMPDLKKPKTIHKYEVEEHTKVITSSHKKSESKSYIKTLNMILIPTLILISSTVMIIYVYQKLKTKKK